MVRRIPKVLSHKAQTLTEEEKAQARANIGASPDQLFFAEYGVTSYDDILAAYNAGKALFAYEQGSNLREVYSLSEYRHYEEYPQYDCFVFSYIYEGIQQQLFRWASNWNKSVHNLATTRYVDEQVATKQDDLGLSPSGDATKFLNEQGEFVVPASGSSSSVFKYEHAESGQISPVTISNSWDRILNISIDNNDFVAAVRGVGSARGVNRALLHISFWANFWCPDGSEPAIDLNTCFLGSCRAEIRKQYGGGGFQTGGIPSFPITSIQGISSGNNVNFADMGFAHTLLVEQPAAGAGFSGLLLNFRCVPEVVVGTSMEWTARVAVVDASTYPSGV